MVFVLYQPISQYHCPRERMTSFENDRKTTLWRRIQHTKSGYNVDPMSYSMANQFKNELKMEGLDSKCYGLHSLRSGGATTAVAMGIPDRLLQ